MSTGVSTEPHERTLRAWHLAILRFAVTLDDTDRLNVLAIAQEIDRMGRKDREGAFHFFRRTSAKLCLAILGRGETGSAILRRYLAQIAEPRLKQAFAAAVGIREPDAAPAKRRPKQDQDLFRGLPSRNVQASGKHEPKPAL
ncbi:hypothetical protein [Bradyrhizobium murdochi]|uniref:hypothetical protein n=1 Tax=Bradyrhizobium murdochi TaxID=1038859 RepID=UPI0004194DF3|nr:hypothetical protein [Bradyrhizobium murdochi]